MGNVDLIIVLKYIADGATNNTFPTYNNVEKCMLFSTFPTFKDSYIFKSQGIKFPLKHPYSSIR